MIHTFTALGQYLVADVNSGAVHVLDRMSYDLLSLLEGEETMTIGYLKRKGAALSPLGQKYLEELEKVTLGGLRRAVLEGDVEMGSVMSGQVAGMLHEIRPVAEIFRDLYESGIARAKATAAEWSDAE